MTTQQPDALPSRYDNAVAIVNDALAEACIPDFIFTEFADMPELSSSVLFFSLTPPAEIAKALAPVMSWRDLGYDDVVGAPMILYQVSPRHIYARCFRPSHLARIKKRALRDEAERAAFEGGAPAEMKREIEQEAKQISDVMTSAIKGMLERGTP